MEPRDVPGQHVCTLPALTPAAAPPLLRAPGCSPGRGPGQHGVPCARLLAVGLRVPQC